MQKTWGQKEFLAEIASLLKIIPAQKSLFKLLANKQSQWITIMSVSPGSCKVLSKLGRQQIHAPIHPAHCINEHTQHTLNDSYRITWVGHSGIWALLARIVLLVSGHNKNQNSLKRHFTWTRRSFFVQWWLWDPLAGPPSIWGFTTYSQLFTRKVSLLAKEGKRQDRLEIVAMGIARSFRPCEPTAQPSSPTSPKPCEVLLANSLLW